MKKRNALTGMYKDAYMRMEKEIDRKPLNGFSARDARDELYTYLYGLEQEQKDIEQDAIILQRLLENKVYESRKERLLLWFVCPMVYIACMLVLDLLTGEEGISSYEISTAIPTSILLNMVLIERKYHTSGRFIIYVLVIFALATVVMLIIPDFMIPMSPMMYVIAILIFVAIFLLVSRMIKQDYKKSKQKKS